MATGESLAHINHLVARGEAVPARQQNARAGTH
jgi:hypothetical protein